MTQTVHSSCRIPGLAVGLVIMASLATLALASNGPASAQDYANPGPEIGIVRTDVVSLNSTEFPSFGVSVQNPDGFGGNCAVGATWNASIAFFFDGDYTNDFFTRFVPDATFVDAWTSDVEAAMDLRSDTLTAGDEVLIYWSTPSCGNGFELVTIGSPAVLGGRGLPEMGRTSIATPVAVLIVMAATTAVVMRRKGARSAT